MFPQPRFFPVKQWPATTTRAGYAGLGAGWAWPGDLSYTTSDADEAPIVYGKVGTWTANKWRAELELSYREHDIEGGTAATSLGGDATVTALMFNMLYDLNVDSELYAGIKPYIGAGAGGAMVATDGTGPLYTVDEEETVFAGQLLAGLNVPITDSVVMDVGYRYFDTLGADISNGIATTEESFSAHTATLGLRWVFGASEPPPPPAPEPVPEPKEALFKIYFPFDDSNLTSEAQETVQEIAAQYKDEQVIRILVQGNTDTSGSNTYNDNLSQARAASVREGLIANGIPAEWIVTEALGETNPAVQTGDGVKEPLNRRAEVLITLE